MPVTPLRPSDPTSVGPHRLLARIGQGGMGTVYLGVSPDERAVAVKVLRDGVTDPDARRRFRSELAALRRVRGPHLVEVLDGDVDADTPYLVTRFVPGQRLDDLVSQSGPLAVDELRVLARGLADALTALHSAGVVHRDLTPGNVLVVDGQPHVIDLGLATAADVTALTRSGMVVGTPGYLAPEQVTGAPVGPPVDVHAWGATVAFAGTGRPPWGTGRPEALLYRIVHERPDLTGLPAPLDQLVRAALDPDPARRPAAGALLGQLGGTTDAPPITVHLPRDVDATTVLSAPALQAASTQVLPALVVPAVAAVAAPAVAARQVEPVRPVNSPVEPVEPVEPTVAQLAVAQSAVAAVAATRPLTVAGSGGGPGVAGFGPEAHGVGADGGLPAVRDRVDRPRGSTVVAPAVDDPWGPAPGPHSVAPAPEWDLPEPAASPTRSTQVLVTSLAALSLVGTLTLAAPVLGVAVALSTLVALRAVGRSSQRLRDRRDRRGGRRRDPVVATLGAPWHLGLGLLDTALSLPLVLAAAALPAGLVWLADPVLPGLERPELTVATATVVALATGLSRRVHRPSRRLLRSTLLAVTPGSAAGVGVFVAVVALAVVLLAVAEGYAPSTWPLPPP